MTGRNPQCIGYLNVQTPEPCLLDCILRKFTLDFVVVILAVWCPLKFWVDFILDFFVKNIYVEKNTSSELTWFCTLTFYYINIFWKKLIYKIKPNFSRDINRPALAIFFAILKKFTATKSNEQDSDLVYINCWSMLGETILNW